MKRKALNGGRAWPSIALLLAALFWPRPGSAVNFANLVSLGGTNGSTPVAALVQDTNGNFYGTASQGPNGSFGTVFEISANGAFSILHTFTGGSDGATPEAPLLLASDGNLYGTTSAGGANTNGTIYQISASGQYTNLAAFNGTNGSSPQAALIQGKDGNFYGTAYSGGTNYGGSNSTYGSVFKFTTNGALVSLFSFGYTNGAYPVGALLQANDGSFYGTTEGGGSAISGTIFRLAANGSFLNLYNFSNAASPQAGLILGPDGLLYGTTEGGGTNTSGSVYALTPAGYGTNSTATVTTVCSFGTTNGENPVAPLVLGTDGNLYGTASRGGTNGTGTIFELSTNGTLTVLYTFSSGGGQSHGSLIQGPDGNFYGTSSQGGKNGAGAVFELSGFPPTILAQPASLTLPNGATAVFTVSAVGSAPLTYQWLSSSTASGNVSGGDTNTLTISDATTLNSGTNWVIVSNESGSITSSPATLDVISTPEVTITSPSPNQRLAQSTITVTGKTADNVAVQRVYCQLDGTGWVLASTANSWTNWSAQFTPAPGSNTVQAYAVNSIGLLSPTSSVSFFSTTMFSALKGTYTGLFFDQTNGVAESSSGYFTISVTARGTLTGTLQMGGGSYPFHGQFDTNATAPVTVSTRNAGTLNLVLQLDLTPGSGRVTGSVKGGEWTAELLGNRSVFNAETNSTLLQGKYTLLLPGTEGATNEPGGDGYGTLAISGSGRITFNGSLADGTHIAQTATVSPGGQWPFFDRLYGGQGSILGWITVTNGASAGLSGTVAWIKPAQTKAKFYPGGFTNQAAAVAGSPYARAAGQAVLDLTNAVLVLRGGGLEQSVTNPIVLGTGSAAKTSSSKVHLSFSLGNGSFGGEVGNADTLKSLAIHGIVLQNLGLGRGYFLNTNQSGEVLLEEQ
jgi:uncharacterized repeat protein (TIGR03803 family)